MSPTKPKTIVVMPTYNEAENLPLITAALFALELEHFELLIVDDNSPDGTGQIAEALRVRYRAEGGTIHVLHRREKQGLGPAYLAGFERALELGADFIIQMDADFSHQPRYIPQLLASASDYDIIIGSRYVPGGGVDESWGFFRKLLSWWANRIYTKTILRIPVNDATGGFRLWKRHAILDLDSDRIHSNGYVFQVENAYIAYKLGYSIGEIPIYFPDRQHGKSKMSPTIALEAAFRVWQILFRHHRLAPKMRHLAKTE